MRRDGGSGGTTMWDSIYEALDQIAALQRPVFCDPQADLNP